MIKYSLSAHIQIHVHVTKNIKWFSISSVMVIMQPLPETEQACLKGSEHNILVYFGKEKDRGVAC